VAIQVQLVKRYLRSKKRNGQREYRWAMRWYDPETGQRPCESTGTADRTQAEALAKVKWAELNIPGMAEPEPEPDPEPVKAPADWLECRDALQRAMEADNLRPNYVNDALMTFDCLKRLFPGKASPADITPEDAHEYKRLRSEAKPAPSAWTIKGDLSTLRAVFGKWLVRECGLLKENPFANVKPPRCDEPEVRIVTAEETEALFDWFATRWNNWRLPAVYLEVAALVGWRASEIASMREDDILADGHIRVLAESSKTRKHKYGWLPKELHDELKTCAAGGYAFGRYADELRRLLMLWKGRPNHAARVRDFAPHRFVAWMQDELQRFHEDQQTAENELAAKEERKPVTLESFTLHDFRRTAITGMQMAGVSEKEASIQVGCTPEVMRRHYERLDGMAIAKRNAERRLSTAGPEAIRLHSIRRASDARAVSGALDATANRTQTVSA
jgi:integrase